jgi:hypothetical protein
MRAFVLALRDMLHGLFGFPSHRISSACAIEARYRGPRRCC